jgi:hypothetical protein
MRAPLPGATGSSVKFSGFQMWRVVLWEANGRSW